MIDWNTRSGSLASKVSGAVLSIACTGAHASADSVGVYVDAAVEAWSNGLPILHVDGTWSKGYKQRSGRQVAYATARAEVGLQSAASSDDLPWRLGAVVRSDVNTKMSGQAAQALYHYQSGTDPDQPGSYDMGTDTQFWMGRGIAVHSAGWRLGGVRMSVSWDHLVLQHVRSVQTAGLITYDANGVYGFQGQARDDNDKTAPRYMSAPSRSGVGDAVSLRASWSRQEGLHADFEQWLPQHADVNFTDVWSRLKWQGINGDDALLNSNVSQRDAEGRVQYRAAINGQYTRRDLTAHIPVAVQAQLRWIAPEGFWTLRIGQRQGLRQHWMGWQHAGDVRYRIEADPVARAVCLGLAWRSLSASLMTDRLDGAARARGAQLAFVVPFR